MDVIGSARQFAETDFAFIPFPQMGSSASRPSPTTRSNSFSSMRSFASRGPDRKARRGTRGTGSPVSPSPGASDYLSDCPDEILLQIFAYLDADALVAVCRLNTRIYDVAVDDALWRPVVTMLYEPDARPFNADGLVSGLVRRLTVNSLARKAPAVPAEDVRGFMVILAKSRCLRCGQPCPDPRTTLGRHVLRTRGQRFCADCQIAVFVPETEAATNFCLPQQVLARGMDLKPIKPVGGATFYLRTRLEKAAIAYYGGKEAFDAELERRRQGFRDGYRALLEGGLMRGPGGRIVLR